MKQLSFESEGKTYMMSYDCPQEEIQDQINEIFSDRCYELAKRGNDLVVLDIGANIGMFSLFIKDYAKKIYALEPSRRMFECLKENVKDWDNIEIFNVGLSNTTGKGVLYGDSPDTAPQNFLKQGTYQEVIDVTTIEQFMKDHSIDHIDVMKIDAEGAEYIILADQTFKSVAPKIDFVIGESHYEAGSFPEAVLMMLGETGFKAELLPIDNYLKIMNYFNMYTGQKQRYEVKKPTMFIGTK